MRYNSSQANINLHDVSSWVFLANCKGTTHGVHHFVASRGRGTNGWSRGWRRARVRIWVGEGGFWSGGWWVGQFLLASGHDHGKKTKTQGVWVERPKLSGVSALPRPGHALTPLMSSTRALPHLCHHRLLRRRQRQPTPAKADCVAFVPTQPPHAHHALVHRLG